MRGQHYTSNTVSVSKWCNTCTTFTPHAVSGHRVTYCLACVEKKEATRRKTAAEIAAAPKQERLFA
jgi:hypothetical protein